MLQTEMMTDNAFVSCLCVTHNRVAMLRRAVACFLDQTYRFRELLVAYNADDNATREYLHSLYETSIVPVELPLSDEISLGAMRNAALAAAQGQYVAIWDDDDWYDPHRIDWQMRIIRRSGKKHCVLRRLLLYDSVHRKAYLSQWRSWEGSLVGLRAEVPEYPNLERQEDTPVVASLHKEDKLAFLDAPQLYVYVYHGTNSCTRRHWDEFLLRYGQVLSEADAARIRAVL